MFTLMSFRVALLSVFFSCLTILTFAQPQANTDADVLLPSLKEMPTEKVFSTDPDGKICFIDFMEIDGYAKQLVVKNESDEVITNERLWDLPDNTLYELDYNEYPKGNYTVVVNTFSKTLVKEIEVK